MFPVTEVVVPVMDCKAEDKRRTYTFAVRAVNIDQNNKMYMGQWSDPQVQDSCFDSGNQNNIPVLNFFLLKDKINVTKPNANKFVKGYILKEMNDVMWKNVDRYISTKSVSKKQALSQMFMSVKTVYYRHQQSRIVTKPKHHIH